MVTLMGFKLIKTLSIVSLMSGISYGIYFGAGIMIHITDIISNMDVARYILSLVLREHIKRSIG